MWEIGAYFGSGNRFFLSAFRIIQQTLPFYKKVGDNKLINSNSKATVRVAGIIRQLNIINYDHDVDFWILTFNLLLNIY